MKKKHVLNVLAFFPERLNMLTELAEDSYGITNFNVIKNIIVDDEAHYVPDNDYVVTMFDWFKTQDKLNPNDYYALGVIGTSSKEKVFKTFKEHVKMKNKQFINLIHPMSHVSKSAILKNGIQIESFCSVSVLTSIGFGVNIKRNCNIGHHCTIGDYVTINPGVTLSGFVNVGPNTMIGSGSVIKDSITIGRNSIIGSGSNVVKDIPDNCIAYGSPCIVHRMKEL